MKKNILTLTISAIMSVCLLASCGGAKTDDGKLVMATNAAFEPYEFIEGGEIVGIDVDMAKAVCEKLGMELVIEDMEFDSIITAVQSGKADIGVAGMTITEDRLKNVDFTTPYTTATQVIIVKEDGATVAKVDDLPGKKIGVQLGTTGDIYASDYEQEGSTIERFNKGTDAVQALNQGKIDCVIIDVEPAKAFVELNAGLKILEEPFELEEYAICVSKDNAALTEKINDALASLQADGTLDKIKAKYISAE